MPGSKTESLELVGCNLEYTPEKPAFEADPTTLRSQVQRPIRVNGKRMLTIDIHAHCQLSDIWPLVEGRPELGGKNPYDDKERKHVENIDARLAQMDEMGLDMQALSITVFQHFNWAEQELAETLVEQHNEKLAEICDAYPDRFVALGVVALQHPKLAARQLDRAVREFGHRGVMITANINGEDLSDPKFHPFWQKAEELDVVIFIHPKHFSEGTERFKGKGFLSNVIGNPLDTSVALAHLIYEGTLDRFPGLKVVFAHGGGFIPSYIGRYDHGHNSADRGGRGDEQMVPSDYLKRLYFDTLVYRTENLAHLIRECGVSQLVLGTDHPAGMANVNAIAHLLSVPGLQDDEIEAILGGNLKELLKLDCNHSD